MLLVQSDAAAQQCIQDILRRVPGKTEEVSDQERRQIQEDCFSEVSGVPGQPVVAGQQPSGDQATSAGGGTAATDAFQQLLEQQRLEQVRLDQEQQRLEQEGLDQTESPPEDQPGNEGPSRGFFTNSAAGEANAVDKLWT